MQIVGICSIYKQLNDVKSELNPIGKQIIAARQKKYVYANTYMRQFNKCDKLRVIWILGKKNIIFISFTLEIDKFLAFSQKALSICQYQEIYHLKYDSGLKVIYNDPNN